MNYSLKFFSYWLMGTYVMVCCKYTGMFEHETYLYLVEYIRCVMTPPPTVLLSKEVR